MLRHWPVPTHGTLVDLDFTLEVSKAVVADNDKAALFGTLDLLFKLPGCLKLYWSFAECSRSRIIILMEWNGHYQDNGRPALPLSRLEPFLASPPRVYEAVLPAGLQDFQPGTKITTAIYDPDSPHAIPNPELAPFRVFPKYTEAALDVATWRANASRISHVVHLSIMQTASPPTSWSAWLRGNPPSPLESPSLRLGFGYPGTVRMVMTPQQFSVPRKPFPRIRSLPLPVRKEPQEIAVVVADVEDEKEEPNHVKKEEEAEEEQETEDLEKDEEDWIILRIDELR